MIASQYKSENGKPAFLSLSEEHIDIAKIIPITLRNHFYTSAGKIHKYPLQAFLYALIIERIFSIPTDHLLLTFLAYSKPLREFCSFTKLQDASLGLRKEGNNTVFLIAFLVKNSPVH